MVLDFTQLATKRDKKNKRPFLNQVLFSTSRSGSNGYQRSFFGGFEYKKFWNWFRSRPEVYSILDIPITDSVGGPVVFTDLNGKRLGRNNRIKAESFWKTNMVREVMKAIEFDRYLTGDAYGYKGFYTDNQRRNLRLRQRKESFTLANQNYAKLGFKSPDMLSDYLYKKAMVDEDITEPKLFDYLASSTIKLEMDKFEIKRYIQNVFGEEQVFFPKEVIHLVLSRVDGKVHGFSPVEAMAAEMYLLAQIKANMIAFFENGGHPSKIYSLPDVKSMDDPGYERLVNLLRENKKVINSNGSLVYVGNLKVDDLGSSPKDMEYKDLLMWVISNMAFAYQIPSSRIPFILSGSGGPVNKGDSQGVSDAGYWRKIETQQDYLEDVYNQQLFGHLGFHIKFVRGNKQDKIRDTQALVQQFDAVAKLQEIAKRQGKIMNDDKFLKMVESTNDEFRDITDDDMERFSDNPMDRQNQMNNMQTLRNEATIDRSNAKRETASNRGVSS